MKERTYLSCSNFSWLQHIHTEDGGRAIKRLFSCVIRPRYQGRLCLIGGGSGALMYSCLKSGTRCRKSRPIFISRKLKDRRYQLRIGIKFVRSWHQKNTLRTKCTSELSRIAWKRVTESAAFSVVAYCRIKFGAGACTKEEGYEKYQHFCRRTEVQLWKGNLTWSILSKQIKHTHKILGIRLRIGRMAEPSNLCSALTFLTLILRKPISNPGLVTHTIFTEICSGFSQSLQTNYATTSVFRVPPCSQFTDHPNIGRYSKLLEASLNKQYILQLANDRK
jgi:hypothetical protein